jgi:hypothetical protein
VPLTGAAWKVLHEARRVEIGSYVFTTNGDTPVSGFSKFKRQFDNLPNYARSQWRIAAMMKGSRWRGGLSAICAAPRGA